MLLSIGLVHVSEAQISSRLVKGVEEFWKDHFKMLLMPDIPGKISISGGYM